jgi:hypothetical protein
MANVSLLDINVSHGHILAIPTYHSTYNFGISPNVITKILINLLTVRWTNISNIDFFYIIIKRMY